MVILVLIFLRFSCAFLSPLHQTCATQQLKIIYYYTIKRLSLIRFGRPLTSWILLSSKIINKTNNYNGKRKKKGESKFEKERKDTFIHFDIAAISFHFIIKNTTLSHSNACNNTITMTMTILFLTGINIIAAVITVFILTVIIFGCWRRGRFWFEWRIGGGKGILS